MKNNLVNILCAIFTLIGSVACATNADLANGWRQPTSEEKQVKWREGSESGFFSVEGDFNNDGLQDSAKIMVHEKGDGIRLLARMSRRKSPTEVYLLDELSGPIYIRAMGIRRVTPGSYQTACGKGYWGCREDEVPEIKIEIDAIEFFKYESASSFFYWDDEESGFKRIWISD